MENIYYHPENHGLKIFAEVERPDMSYEFSMFVVWVGKRGGLYYAFDSGCSCPAPFEDYYSIESLTPVGGKRGLESFLTALTGWRDWNRPANIDYVRRKVRKYIEERD